MTTLLQAYRYGSNMPLLKGRSTYKYHVYWVELIDMGAKELAGIVRRAATDNDFTFTISDDDYQFAGSPLSSSSHDGGFEKPFDFFLIDAFDGGDLLDWTMRMTIKQPRVTGLVRNDTVWDVSATFQQVSVDYRR